MNHAPDSNSAAFTTNIYPIEIPDSLIDEWDAIAETFFPGVFSEMQASRLQWMAVAYAAIGKAVLIRRGDYGMTLEGVDEGETIEEYNDRWAEELEDLAELILSHFQPGDGKL
jgi:hypothetical protein